jgi:hypothetical protein
VTSCSAFNGMAYLRLLSLVVFIGGYSILLYVGCRQVAVCFNMYPLLFVSG